LTQLRKKGGGGGGGVKTQQQTHSSTSIKSMTICPEDIFIVRMTNTMTKDSKECIKYVAGQYMLQNKQQSTQHLPLTVNDKSMFSHSITNINNDYYTKSILSDSDPELSQHNITSNQKERHDIPVMFVMLRTPNRIIQI